MTKAKAGVTTHLYVFDSENRLTSVKVGSGTPTTFAYDAGGQRVMTTYPDGTIVHTPFPDYELTDPPGTGANTLRTTYRLAGQIVAVKTRTGTSGTGKLYFTFTDHLGNIAGLREGSTFTSGSLARFDPFGNYRTTPSTNPTVTNQGFTGHRHNNAGTYDLGLIYMNARYYLPEVGRFISPDTLVPDPANPQSYNRYSYVHNNPMNYTDPTGHCAQDDDVCWALADELYRLYGWRIVGIWTQQELHILLQAGNLITGWLRLYGEGDATGRVRSAFLDIRFKHGDLIGEIVVPGRHHVRGSNIYLLPGFDLRTVIHELGHVLDNHLGFGLPIGSALFGGGPADDMAIALGADPSTSWLRSGRAGYDTPLEPISGRTYSEYARSGPSEDFAEAFSRSVLDPYGFQNSNPLRAKYLSNIAASLVTNQSEFIGPSVYFSQRIMPVAAPVPSSQ